jgi:hypothetical protein
LACDKAEAIFCNSDNDANFHAIDVQEDWNTNTKVSIDLAKKTGEECKQMIGIDSEGPLSKATRILQLPR